MFNDDKMGYILDKCVDGKKVVESYSFFSGEDETTSFYENLRRGKFSFVIKSQKFSRVKISHHFFVKNKRNFPTVGESFCSLLFPIYVLLAHLCPSSYVRS